MVKRMGLLAIGVGVVISIGALGLGIIIPWAWGKDVIMISPHAPDVVDLNRISWTKGENAGDIYGIQNGGKTRIVFTDPGRIIVPEQDSSLLLYRVDKQSVNNPLQGRTVTSLSRRIAVSRLA